MLGGILSEWAMGMPKEELGLKLEPLKAAPFYMSFGPQLTLRYYRVRDWLQQKAMARRFRRTPDIAVLMEREASTCLTETKPSIALEELFPAP